VELFQANQPSQLNNRNSQLPQAMIGRKATVESILFKRVEKALQESQGLTRDILDSAFDAIISMDGDGRVINWNKRAETIFGWSSSETIGLTLSEIVIPPQFRESHEKGLERFLASGKSKVINQQIEIFALHKDGHEFPVEISISATPWEDSFIFNGIIRDTSGRKQAEEQAKQKTEEYEVMHEIAKVLHGDESLDTMLQMTIKAIVDSKAFNFENDAGIFLSDNKENKNLNLVTHVGEFSKNFLAMDRGILRHEDLFGKDWNSGELSLNNFCLLNSGQAIKCHEIENKGLYIIPLQSRNELVGLMILFAGAATPSYERNKEILESIGTLIANTVKQYQCEEDLIKKNRAMAGANKKLAELNELKNRFLGIASHDLRNPLYLIKAYSEILKDDLNGKISNTRQNYLKKIFAASQFMETLLDNLLDISNIESGKYDLKKNEECLNALTKSQMGTHELLAKKKNIRIALELGNIPTVHCDKNAIIQIMGNFIGNAIKFSPANTKFTVRTAREGNAVRFSVTDEGPGICSEEQKLLFGEFQTLSNKPTGGEKSTGLGLAIVKKLVNLHGGNVGVNSGDEKGCTFFFDLAPYDATLLVESPTEGIQRLEPVRPEILPHPTKRK
jgi:two-component system sensor histidine kinase/response regulator